MKIYPHKFLFKQEGAYLFRKGRQINSRVFLRLWFPIMDSHSTYTQEDQSLASQSKPGEQKES